MSRSGAHGRAVGLERPATAERGLGATVAVSAAAVFLALLTLLAMRVAQGQDPALRQHAAAAAPPRRVLVRRIDERRVIVHLPPDAPSQPNSASQQVGGSGAFGPSAVTRTS